MEERINPENEVIVQSEPAESLAEEREEIREAAQSAAAGKKSGTIKKMFNILGNGLFALLLLTMVFLVFTMVQSRLIGGPPSVAGYQMYIVQGGSMSPAFEAGSLAFLQPVDAGSVGVGDIITYRPSQGNTLTTHRVVEVNSAGGDLSFTTRGDANNTNDSLPVYPENLVGQVAYAVPYAGFLMHFGQSRTGIITLIFIPGALIIAFELRNLFQIAAEWETQKKNAEKAKNDSPSEEAS